MFSTDSSNSHNPMIFQSTNLRQEIAENSVISLINQNEKGVKIQILVLGDSLFPFSTWLMKPYTNPVLSKEQVHFNYRQSQARMVVERAYGQLKRRWWVLMQKNESHKKTVKRMTLACIGLHNICIDIHYEIPKNWDINYDSNLQRITLCYRNQLRKWRIK